MINFNKFLELLSYKERGYLYFLLGMIVFMAMLDMIGVASIMPFIAVLANPNIITTNEILSFIFKALYFSDPHIFLYFLGILVFFLLVVSLTFRALTTYLQIRFALMLEFALGKRVMEGYLRQPYSWFLNRHSSDLSKTILSDIQTVILLGIIPLMQLIAQGAVVLALFILLMLVDPSLALLISSSLSLVYGIIIFLISRRLINLGQLKVNENQRRFKILTEAFSAIKLIKVSKVEKVYIDKFSLCAETYAKVQTAADALGQLPRFILELIAFGSILLIILYLMKRGENFSNILPIISLYAFAGYRLMPALQGIYRSITQLRFSSPSLDLVYSELKNSNHNNKADFFSEPIDLKRYIKLKNIIFFYPNAKKPALNNISLSIAANSTVGIVGSTGSGKTTIVDILLGLLNPQKGLMLIDGKSIKKINSHNWQRSIGYVPQHIYLADATISSNIAFGLSDKEINQDAVERAAKIANLHEFVTKKLPNGYATKVGERGARLSGGQCQQIGIARALYNNPQILILDEATSALDNISEKLIINAINKISHHITIIIIAHRLNTVRNCDEIFLLSNGLIEGKGTYKELSKSNMIFKKMIRGHL